MANLRAIRSRIKSVESTQQITKSMKMVAAAKLRRTQSAFESLKAFATESEKILAQLPQEDADSPFLKQHEERKTVCYVLMVGNRGLCGTYNAALLRYQEQLVREETETGAECFLVVCGRWGKDMIAQTKIPVRRTVEISDTPTAAEAEQLTETLKELYTSGEADEIVLIFQQYRTVLQQIPGKKTLLPVTRKAGGLNDEGGKDPVRIIFEPDQEPLLRIMVDLYLTNTVHAALLEARVGEHSARMTAMTSASDSTEELIADLTLELNHARQAAITTEITEIASGAEALRNRTGD